MERVSFCIALTLNVLLVERFKKMRSLKANRVIKVSLINDELPPWHEDEVKTFYIQGFGFVFESRLSEVLKAEYLINLAFSKTRYLTMENVLFMFGLPSKYVDSHKIS